MMADTDGLAGILDHAPALVAVHEGPEHVYVYSNAAHDEALGHRPLIGRPLREAMPELDGTGVFERFDAVLAHGERIETPELRFSSGADGEARWYRQILQPREHGDGTVRGVVSFAYDVTAQVEARRLAERHRTELAFALEAGHGIGAWDWAVGADEVRVDARFARLYGVDPEAAEAGLGVAHFTAAIHEDDRERVVSAIERAVATGEDFHETYRVPGAEGRLAWVAARGRCFHDEAGRPTRFPGVVVDITETVAARERIEASRAALHASEDRHRRATAAGRVGTFEYYPRERRADWDAMTVAIFGFPAGEAIPLDAIAEVVYPDDRPAWERDVAAALDPNGEGVHHVEMRITRPSDGATRWIEGKGRTTFEDGEAVLMLGTIRDVTERRDYEERLRLLNRELNHRVKNLFAVVQSLVLTSAGGARDVAEFSAKLRGRLAALAAAHLVGIADEQLAPIPLREVIDAVLAPYDSGGLALDGEAVALAPRMATPIGLVLHELATNAAKHGALSRLGGALTLSWRVAEGRDGRQVELSWRERCPGSIAEPAGAARGFGTRLVDGSVAQLGGEIVREWRRTGLALRLTVPLEGNGTS